MGYGCFLLKCATFSQFFSCRKGPAALQRGPRCIATSTPLQFNKHAAADQRGPYGKTTSAPKTKNDAAAVGKRRFPRFFGAFSIVKINNHFFTSLLARRFSFAHGPDAHGLHKLPSIHIFVVYASPKRRVATRRDRLRANSFIPVGWVYKWAFVRLYGWHGGVRDGSRPYVWVVLQRQRLGRDANSSLKKSNIGKKNVNLHKISIIHP